MAIFSYLTIHGSGINRSPRTRKTVLVQFRDPTDRPTAERLLNAFDNLALYRHETDTEVGYEVTPLSSLQRRILQALGLPESIYAPPAAPIIDSG